MGVVCAPSSINSVSQPLMTIKYSGNVVLIESQKKHFLVNFLPRISLCYGRVDVGMCTTVSIPQIYLFSSGYTEHIVAAKSTLHVLTNSTACGDWIRSFLHHVFSIQVFCYRCHVVDSKTFRMYTQERVQESMKNDFDFRFARFLASGAEKSFID